MSYKVKTEIEYFEFSELSDNAKKKAIEAEDRHTWESGIGNEYNKPKAIITQSGKDYCTTFGITITDWNKKDVEDELTSTK